MKLLAISDLCVRWNYSKAGIHKLTKTKNFPAPIGIICRGRIKIFLEDDITNYEEERPWLFDEGQKMQRQKLYAKLQQAKDSLDPQIKFKLYHGDMLNWLVTDRCFADSRK